jgi:GAF domain-containing protein
VLVSGPRGISSDTPPKSDLRPPLPGCPDWLRPTEAGTLVQPEHNEADSMGALARIRLPDVPVTDLLQRVAEIATRSTACTFAGITLSDGDRMQTPVYTDERSPKVDQVQYDTGSGPCVDAARTGEIFTIPDTSTEARWRPFSEAALAENIRSTLSVPLDVSGNRSEVLGALNLYSEIPDAFDADAVAATQSLAHQAAIVVANAQAYWGAKQESEHLQKAMESRAVIEQAKGILMAQSRLSADDAFDLLVRASQRENRKLREIAAEIVARVEQPEQ